MLDIRSSELNAMESEYVSAKAELKVAEREWESAEALYSDRMLSEKEFAEAQSRLKQAEAAYNKAKNDRTVFSEEKENGIFTIKAPMDGYVIDKRVTAGSTIDQWS